MYDTLKKTKIELLDSTIREGVQTANVYLSIDDKKHVIEELDEFGIRYIEVDLLSGDYNVEKCLYNSLKLKNSQLVGFSCTRKKDILVQDSIPLNNAIEAPMGIISIFGKSSDYHVTEVISTSLDENINMIKESVEYVVAHGKRVFFDAEHFFDGYKRNNQYALQTIEAAVEAGAELIVLCDTNGGTMPWDIYSITQSVVEHFAIKIGIHCHDDCGLAIANSIAALQAGAVHIQGTFLGIGERCGNACLSTIIAILQLKMNQKCVSKDNMKQLVQKVRNISSFTNYEIDDFAPFVGKYAFLHKAGVHIDGVNKIASSYEHICPEAIGNKRKMVVSEVAGKSLLIHKLKVLNILSRSQIKKINAEKLDYVLKEIKSREKMGYNYEEAEGSFVVFLQKAFGVIERKVIVKKINVVYQESEGRSIWRIDILVNIGSKLEDIIVHDINPIKGLFNGIKNLIDKEYPEKREISLEQLNYASQKVDMNNLINKIILTICLDNTEYKTIGVSNNYIEACCAAVEDAFQLYFADNLI